MRTLTWVWQTSSICAFLSFDMVLNSQFYQLFRRWLVYSAKRISQKLKKAGWSYGLASLKKLRNIVGQGKPIKCRELSVYLRKIMVCHLFFNLTKAISQILLLCVECSAYFSIFSHNMSVTLEKDVILAPRYSP